MLMGMEGTVLQWSLCCGLPEDAQPPAARQIMEVVSRGQEDVMQITSHGASR